MATSQNANSHLVLFWHSLKVLQHCITPAASEHWDTWLHQRFPETSAYCCISLAVKESLWSEAALGVCVCARAHSVVFDCLWHHGLQPAKLLSWDCWVEYIKMRRILNGVHSLLCGCQKHGSGESKPTCPMNEYSRKTLCSPFYEGRDLVWWPAPRRLAGALSYGTVLEMLSHCCWHLGVWAEVMARSSLVREMHIAEPVCFLCPHDHCYMSPLTKQYHAWTRRLTDIYRAGHLTPWLPRASSAIGTFWWALAEPQISAFYGPIHIISKPPQHQILSLVPSKYLIIYPNSYVVF